MLSIALYLLTHAMLLSLHLSGGSFPRPLSAQEEKKYVERMLAGDIEARNVLVEHNLRLVAHIAKKYYTQSDEQDDLISIGTIGLIKAINTYRSDKNIKLATYASRCIENEILMYLRKNANQKAEVSFDEPLNTDWDGNELLLSDILGSDANAVSQQLEQDAERAVLRSAVAALSARERQIMELRFGLTDGVEHTQKEAADALGISQSYISRLEKRIIQRLKKEILRLS
jgi:RNA polymerase sporulation-specific sigma factor